MISRYRSGMPIDTKSIVEDIKISDKNTFVEKYKTDDKFVINLSDNSYIYGLGGSNRGINKKGYIYESFCSDDPVHTEDKKSLYAAQNFFVFKDENILFGIYLDTPEKITYDIGYTDIQKFTITLSSNDYEIYYITGENILDIVRQFRKIIGKSYIAPRWSFGYGQSRWGYINEKDVLEVYENYNKNDMPLDMIYLDIDYMENYKDFTVDSKKYSDLKKLTENLKNDGVHLVPIIDAGVKIEKDYEIYEEGIKNNYFCFDENKKPFVGAVWPGLVHFPDFLNADARKWFGSKYKKLMDLGIDGFWNDMNEPAIFFSKNGIENMYKKISENMGNLDVDLYTLWSMKDSFLNMSNSEADYKSFYHNYDGKIIRHDKVHNLYGYNMTKAAMEQMYEMTNDRVLLFSRASFIGMHRYGGIWTGDNSSWWKHILLSLQMMPGLNMCGFMYVGSDLGGFGSNVTEDLMIRWLQFGLFSPLMRNHSALGTKNQELYRFSNKEVLRNILNVRYMLLPYIYSEYMKAILRDDMYFKPLSFVYEDDKRCLDIENQLIIGNELMIAPIYEQNANGRYVYIPETMKMIRFKKDGSLEERIYEKGDYYIEMNLYEFVIFIRNNTKIPLTIAKNRVSKIDFENLKFLGFDNASYEYYFDDGKVREISEENIRKI